MPRSDTGLVSVVVIARDEEPHLLGCLRSLARQTYPELEVIVVDDGSADATMAIGERVAADDARFQVLRLTGGGRSAARNEGVAAATGEFLCFVDGDDALADDALELLRRSLAASGSDVAVGAVRPLDERAAPTSAPERLGTTLPRTPELLATTALGGRLWRRDAWDALGLRFDDRLEVHEDLPVVTVAMARARAVDLVPGARYLHRQGDEGAAGDPAPADLDTANPPPWPVFDVDADSRTTAPGSVPDAETRRRTAAPAVRPGAATADGTAVAAGQGAAAPARPDRALRRLEPGVLGALIAAVDQADGALRAERPTLRRAALRALFATELAASLHVADLAGPAWQAAFAAATRDWLLHLRPHDLRDRPALERTLWALLRTGRVEAAAHVLHAERSGHAPPPVRRRGRLHVGWAGLDALPGHATRLTADDLGVPAEVVLEELHPHGGVLELGGRARIGGGPATRIALRLVPRPTGDHRLPASPVLLRTAASATPGDFGTTLSPAAVREGDGWTSRVWDLWAEVGAGRLRRHVDRFTVAPAAHRTTFLPAAGDRALVRSTVHPDGRVTLRVDARWACARRQRTALGGLLVVHGELRLDAEPLFELRRRSDGHRRRQPLQVDRARIPHRFEATVPLHDLAEAPAAPGARPGDAADAQQVWEAWLVDASGEHRIALPADVPVAAWFVGDRVVSLLPTADGDAVLVEQERRPAVSRERRPVAARVRVG